jgi:hypothetical protein
LAIVDAFGNRCDRALTLHVRKIHRIEFDVLALLKHTQAIFGKYNILLRLGSLESVHMDKPSHARLAIVEPEVEPGKSSAEQTELYRRFGVQDLQSVTAFLVDELTSPANSAIAASQTIEGVASHLPHRPAIFFARQIHPTAIAHELGHVLMESDPGEHHTEGAKSVMASGQLDNQYAFSAASPQFTTRQLLTIRRSPLLRVC